MVWMKEMLLFVNCELYGKKELYTERNAMVNYKIVKFLFVDNFP